tara:strand:+ start:338 stop:526 length:189 start_codon:yes stop_codon:yes gene_type:complete
MSKSRALNKVCAEECLDAIDYFWTEGFLEELTSDKKHYTEILLKKVANCYDIQLKERDKVNG